MQDEAEGEGHHLHSLCLLQPLHFLHLLMHLLQDEGEAEDEEHLLQDEGEDEAEDDRRCVRVRRAVLV